MLDYYGSIIKSNKEIDTEIINKYKNECNIEYIKRVIYDLRKEDVIMERYSISGWNSLSYKKIIFEAITKKINYQKQMNELKLKSVYCLRKFFELNNINDNDIIEYIVNNRWINEDVVVYY
tara:strand:- start:1363 stop:1725 length:363 start_codon:yes stop_codon:yes gene_type:complete